MAGPTVIVEPSSDTPLVWVEIAIGGGAAADPVGIEGLHRHAAMLARRGAGPRDRTQLDEAFDSYGAMFDIGAGRDTISASVLVLSRHLDAVVDLAADVLAEPRFSEEEHARLLRETPQILDEIRDDDSSLTNRYFDWLCAPGHPYGRTSVGTDASIKRIERTMALELWRREVVPENMIIGIAGDIDEATAARIVERLTARLRHGTPAPTPISALDSFQPPRGRRLVVVDKSERTQANLRIGHLSPRYGHADTPALAVGEAILGGPFSSRLMQEVRVKRGWSYGVGAAFRRGRLPHWFDITTAVGIEVAGPAVELLLKMFEDFATVGPTDAEFEFARSYLVGAMPFHVATARQRMQLAVRDALFELPANYSTRLPESLNQLTAADVRAACARHMRPDDVVTVAVTTASRAASALAAANAGPLTVLKHDAY